MSSEIHLYKPVRSQVAFLCICTFLGISLNVYYLLDNRSVALYCSLFILASIFVFLFLPFIKNQKLIISDDEICLFSYGKANKLNICNHLNEIVVKDKEIVSYRLENDGDCYQISPKAYYESEELNATLNTLYVKCKNTVSVVQI